MAKTLKMNYDDIEIVKNNFYNAQDDLESRERRFPKSVDGGGGTEYTVEIITKIVEDVGDIATCSELGGDKMVNAMSKIKGVNGGAAQMFREMEEEIS